MQTKVSNPRKITIIISSLVAGGAERVVSLQANYWASKGWNVTVITCAPEPHEVFFELHPAVKQVNVDFGLPSEGIIDGIRKNFRRNFALRKAIIDSESDCIVSHLITVNIRSIFASRGLRLPVIVTEHTPPGYSGLGRGLEQFRLLVYPWATVIVAPTQKVIESLSKNLRNKGIEIPNPVFIEKLEEDITNTPLPGRTNIAAMGRLDRVKRFDLLLQAFAKLSTDTDCCLNIVGEGPLSAELQRLAVKLGVDHLVCFWGFIKNPWGLLKKADMLVLSSEMECFPMVLLEAMTCGLPVVSFDCPVGPREIISNGIDGVLVPPLDVDALARSMERLLNDDAERLRLGLAAAKSAERFSVELIMKQWDDLIERVICGERST